VPRLLGVFFFNFSQLRIVLPGFRRMIYVIASIQNPQVTKEKIMNSKNQVTITALVLSIITSVSVMAGTTADFTGAWKSVIDDGTEKIKAKLILEQKQQKLGGKFVFVDFMGGRQIELKKVKVNGQKLRFLLPIDPSGCIDTDTLVWKLKLQAGKLSGTVRTKGQDAEDAITVTWTRADETKSKGKTENRVGKAESADSKKLIRRYENAFNKADLTALKTMLSPDLFEDLGGVVEWAEKNGHELRCNITVIEVVKAFLSLEVKVNIEVSRGGKVVKKEQGIFVLKKSKDSFQIVEMHPVGAGGKDKPGAVSE
jgi:hypothetical protein